MDFYFVILQNIHIIHLQQRYKNIKRYLLAFITLLVFVATVFADTPTTATENNPRINSDANACYIGSSLYGKCETTDVDMDKKITEEEVKYMYTAGWFVIRFEKGMILRSQVPRMYRWLLGPEPVKVEYPSAPTTLATGSEPTCTVALYGEAIQLIGFSSVQVPLSVVNGTIDPNHGASNPVISYGFDWSGSTLTLFRLGPTGFGIFYNSNVPGWNQNFVSLEGTTCPVSTPPQT